MIPYLRSATVEIPILHWNLHPHAFLFAIGILLGVRQVVARSTQLGLDTQLARSMSYGGILSGFIVAHLFDVIAYQPPAAHIDPWILLNPAAGLSSFGGLFGATAFLFVWAQWRGWSLLACLDAAAYGGMTGWFFGRLGCFIAHGHPGTPTCFALGVDYGNHPPGGIRHDLGLYEALITLCLLALFRILARRSRPAGTYLMLMVWTYAPLRFGLDFLRIEDVRYRGLTPAQFGSLAMLAAGFCLAVQGMLCRPIRRPLQGEG